MSKNRLRNLTRRRPPSSQTDIISVGAGRFHRVEILFLPSFIGTEASSFHDTPSQNVMRCDVYIREELYATVVVSGGTALFQGIIVDMTKELTTLAPFTRDLSEHLRMNVTEREDSFTAAAEREIVPVVKEILCYLRLDYDTEPKSTAEFDKKKTHVLPDRSIIIAVPNVSFGAKVLFQPESSRK